MRGGSVQARAPLPPPPPALALCVLQSASVVVDDITQTSHNGLLSPMGQAEKTVMLI